MTLTKADIVETLYKAHDGFTKAEATEAVEAFLRLSKNVLISGEDLLFSGFGKFSVRSKKERKGRNPQTGEKLMLAPRRVITFKPSGQLRTRVQEDPTDDSKM